MTAAPVASRIPPGDAGARLNRVAPQSVGLLADLAAFVEQHRRCGELDGAAEGCWVRVRRDCGAELVWRADEED